MKRKIILTTLILNFVLALSTAAQDDRGAERSERIAPNIVRVSGVEDAVYSPSGKFLAIQFASNFLIFPARKPPGSNDDLVSARHWNGRIMGFLSTETLVYSADGEIFA